MPDELSCKPEYSQMPHVLVTANILQPSNFQYIPMQVITKLLGAAQMPWGIIARIKVQHPLNQFSWPWMDALQEAQSLTLFLVKGGTLRHQGRTGDPHL